MNEYNILVGQIYKWHEVPEYYKIESFFNVGNKKYIKWSMSSDIETWDIVDGNSDYEIELLSQSLNENLCILYRQSNNWSLTPLKFI